MLEALFLPPCRKTLKTVMDCLSRKTVPSAQLLRDHWKQTLALGKKADKELHERCDPSLCWNHEEERDEPEVDFASFVEFLVLQEVHLRNRSDFVLGNIKQYEDQEQAMLDKWDAMSEAEQQAFSDGATALGQKAGVKVTRAETRSRSGSAANAARALDAAERVKRAIAALKSRNESISISSVAKEGKLSRSTVKKHKDLLS